MCFSLDKFQYFMAAQFKFIFPVFDLVHVFCSFFDSTGWGCKE